MAKPLLSKKKQLALQQTLDRAVNLHRMGMLAEAAPHYLQVLAAQPRHFEAQHLLGVLRAQQNRLAEALELVGAALRTKSDSAIALSDFGLILHKLGRHEEALASFERALAIKPDHAPALSNRGNALARLGRHQEALASYDGALRIKPDYPEALSNRGHALMALGRYDEAQAAYGKALALRPQDADALHGRGNALCALGRHEEALTSFDGALAARPDHIDALYDRANALAALNRYEAALAGYERVLAARPDDAAALTNRGNALLRLKRWDEALAGYERALALRSDDANALNNRGTAFKEQKQFEAALSSYDAALTLQPEFPDALYNRANVLKDMKRYEEALAAYDRARAIAPDHPDACGLIDAAMAVCDWQRTAQLADELTGQIEAGRPFTPFALLGFCDDPALHLRCARDYIADRIPTRSARSPARPTVGHDKIRVAYLSADLHEHATAYLIAGLFELHDRARFDVLGVSFGRDDDSDMRRRLVKAFDQFRDVRAMSDGEASALLDGLEADIVVDLKGYTQDCRPELLARRSAPIQVNYLGYPGTMGADFIDYVIADAVTVPFDQQPFYTEKIVHLPDCYQVNDHTRRIGEPTPSRREAGLPEQGFVFCCFNNNYKITASVFDVWMRLLAAVPGSVLWLLGDNAGAQNNLRREAQARGVDPARLIFAPRQKLAEHLARHRLADLFLDTLPYNAHTTASDALWAGVPVVTCRGRAFAGRVAASLLHAIGLPELVTRSLADYEALALRLATDPAQLGEIRATLARNRQTHPLFDTDRFRRHIEAAYGRMWEHWQRGEPPRGFAVEPI